MFTMTRHAFRHRFAAMPTSSFIATRRRHYFHYAYFAALFDAALFIFAAAGLRLRCAFHFAITLTPMR